MNAQIGIDVGRDLEATHTAKAEVVAESFFPGHEPVEPTLKYLKNEQAINALIKMRMHQRGPLSKQRLSIKLSNSSGMREKDALKIDRVLQSMKVLGNATVSNEFQNESRRFLEYEIDFQNNME